MDFPNTVTNISNSSDMYSTVDIVILAVNGCNRFLCITGNMLVLINFVVFKSLQQTRHAFSINMAISDIQAGLFTVTVMESFLFDRYKFNFQGCEYLMCYPTVVLLASTLSVLFSSLDRFISMKFALRYQVIVTKWKVLLASGFIWSFAILVGCVPLYGLELESNYVVTYCQGRYKTNVYYFSAVSFGIPVPTAITVALVYTYISRIARKHEEHSRRFAQRSPELYQGADKLSKSVRLLLVICVMMDICWMPLAITSVINMITPDYDIRTTYTFKITSTLFVAPHAVNPWVYTLRNAEFRDASKQLCQIIYRKIRSCFHRNPSTVRPTLSGTELPEVSFHNRS